MDNRVGEGGAIPWIRETELFTSGAEGYHTFRIPSLVVANDGTILAFCEGRKYGQDDSEALYLVLKRSTDNGVTWQSLQVIAGDGQTTTHNPTAVVDKDTDTVWLLFNKDCDTSHAMSSTDSGATWSEPVDITADVKLPSWTFYCLGPGHGIQLRDGVLVIPCHHGASNRRDSVFSHSHVIYSDDHGRHWKRRGDLPGGSNESTAVEMFDGSLYMAVRSADRRINKRLCSRSGDGGATWSELIELDQLADPECQASIVRFTDEVSYDRNRVIFSNLNSTSRDAITLRVSYDECKTWTVSKLLYPGPSAYSDLAVASDLTICCLYERGVSDPYESIKLAQFNIEWLTDGADHVSQAGH